MSATIQKTLWVINCSIAGAGIFSYNLHTVRTSITGVPIGTINASLHGPVVDARGGGVVSSRIPLVNVVLSDSTVRGTLDVKLHRVRVGFSGSWVVPGSINATLHNVVVAATGYGGPTNFDITLHPPLVFLLGTGDIYNTISVNTHTGGVTIYNNHSFTSYIEVDEVWYGVNSDGIFELSGTTDDGAQLNTDVVTGYANMKAGKSISINDLYAALTSSDSVDFGVAIDNIVGDLYTIESTYDRYRLRKLNIGKGRCGTKFALKIASSDYFDLDYVTVTADEKTRMHPGLESYVKAKLPMVEVS